MRKKRIIITVTNNLVSDNRVAKVARYLEDSCYEVLIVGRTYPGDKVPEGRAGRIFRFRMLFNKGVLFFAFINIKLFFFLIFHRADWYIAVDLDTLLACNAAGFIKRVPVIMDSHEYFTEAPELSDRHFVRNFWLKLERILLPSIYAGITVSPGIVDIYKKKYNIDFHLVRNIPLRKEKISSVKDVSNTPIVYYQGALNMGRGIEATLKALVFLPGYRFVIVGTGDISHELKELAHELQLDDRVDFIGKVPFEKLEIYNSKAHVGLCLLENIGLNYYYSLPNRIFDYPSCGLPVIATKFPDISRIVQNFETGLLVESLEPEIIADAIRRACTDKSLREKWKTSLPAAAMELTWENEVKVFDDILGKKGL